MGTSPTSTIMRPPFIRLCRLATVIVAAVASGFCIGFCANLLNPSEPCESLTTDLNFRRKIARIIDEAVLELEGCSCATRALLAIEGVMAQLDSQRAISAENVLLRTQQQQSKQPGGSGAAITFAEASHSADACWEEYTGSLWEQGFKPARDCRPEEKPPLEELVTAVLLAPPFPNDASAAPDAPLEALRRRHPRLPAVVAATGAATRSASIQESTILLAARADDFSTPGALLNRLVQNVSSRYALLVRDAVLVDELARLQRLVYVISALGGKVPPSGDAGSASVDMDTWGLAVAGGAVRDAKGYWSAGCAETSLRNYALRIKPGYRYSALDCMLCDQLRGPFLARTSLLRQVPFSEDLPAAVVFEDWFLRVKRRGALVAGCPDALFFVGGAAEGILAEAAPAVGEARRTWGELADAWQVDHVLLPGRDPVRFSCSEINLLCNLYDLQKKSLLIPSCCFQPVAGALYDFDSFAAHHQFDYEMMESSALGAVKLQSVLPWDDHGDIFIRKEDYETYRRTIHEISAKGFPFNYVVEKVIEKCFKFYTPNICFDICCSEVWGTSLFPKEMQNVPTRVIMMGIWMRGPWNPGLFARNRYGPGYLKHAHHWTNRGLINLWEPYSVDGSGNCSVPNHHACLNRYPTDGSFNLLPED